MVDKVSEVSFCRLVHAADAVSTDEERNEVREMFSAAEIALKTLIRIGKMACFEGI